MIYVSVVIHHSLRICSIPFLQVSIRPIRNGSIFWIDLNVVTIFLLDMLSPLLSLSLGKHRSITIESDTPSSSSSSRRVSSFLLPFPFASQTYRQRHTFDYYFHKNCPIGTSFCLHYFDYGLRTRFVRHNHHVQHYFCSSPPVLVCYCSAYDQVQCIVVNVGNIRTREGITLLTTSSITQISTLRTGKDLAFLLCLRLHDRDSIQQGSMYIQGYYNIDCNTDDDIHRIIYESHII